MLFPLLPMQVEFHFERGVGRPTKVVKVVWLKGRDTNVGIQAYSQLAF